MMRRAVILFASLTTCAGAVLLPASPTVASPVRDLNPQQLQIPAASLPAGANVLYFAVSGNADADGAPGSTEFTNDLQKFHPTQYSKLGRITGYRERFKFTVQGVNVTTQYMASQFASPAAASAALADSTTGIAPLTLLGTPLTPGCTAGESCVAVAGAYDGSEIVYVAFTRGTVLVEFASAVSPADWAARASDVRAALYALATATDAVVQSALAGAGSTGTPVASPTANPTPSPTPAPAAPPAKKLSGYYLALGDSYAAGYLTEVQTPDIACAAADAPGFVCVFWRYLKGIKPDLQLNNLAVPGADSCDLAGEGHRCYDTTPRPSPVDAAVAFIKAHPGEVSPITLTIGGNDLLALLSTALKDPSGTLARLPGIFERYRKNLHTVLSRLRTAAPDATIIVTTQPNPFGGLADGVLPPGLNQLAVLAIKTLNDIMKSEAPQVGAIIADSAAAFDAYPGGGSALTFVTQFLSQGRFEIHPTPKGYQVYGQAVIAAAGYFLPARITAHLARKRVSAKGTDKVTGTTVAGATVKIQLRIPGAKARTFSLHASSGGKFAKTFKVGTRSGKGTVKACATDSHRQSACTGKMSFLIR